jgi:hypothetical protein
MVATAVEVDEESLNSSDAGDNSDGDIGLLKHWSLFDVKLDKGVDLPL